MNAGKDCALAVDQRYQPRNSQCDIGADEYEPTRITLTADASAPVNATNGWARVTGTVACSRPGQVDLQLQVGSELDLAQEPLGT